MQEFVLNPFVPALIYLGICSCNSLGQTAPFSYRNSFRQMPLRCGNRATAIAAADEQPRGAKRCVCPLHWAGSDSAQTEKCNQQKRGKQKTPWTQTTAPLHRFALVAEQGDPACSSCLGGLHVCDPGQGDLCDLGWRTNNMG